MSIVRALLDVNVLIALMDSDHVNNKLAWKWFEANIKSGWASCPTTQNGCIRIMSQSGYPNHFGSKAVAEKLALAVNTPHHKFWSDSVSMLDERIVDWQKVIGPKQLTDVYLLALAVNNGGRFVTFDKKIPVSLVMGATDVHYECI